MKKLNFKVGDWVTLDSEICKILEDNGSTYKVKVYRSLERSHPDYLIQDAFKEYIQEWRPKEGEWCWFKKEADTIYSLAKFEAGDIYDSESAIKSIQLGSHGNSYWDICRPFIGELPYEN